MAGKYFWKYHSNHAIQYFVKIMNQRAQSALMTLGTELKRRRLQKGLSQRALAHLLGTHQPLIAKAEKGDDMLVSRLEKMVHALGCELALQTPPEETPPPSSHNGTAPSLAVQSRLSTSDQDLLASYRREYPDRDPHIYLLGVLIQRLSLYLSNGVKRMSARYNMSSGELFVLGTLRRQGAPYESTLSNLRRQFWISLPGMSKRIDNLERLGLVERISNPNDRRGSLIRLTPQGLALQQEHMARHSREFTAISNMDSNERSHLVLALSQLLEAFQHTEAEHDYSAPQKDIPAQDMAAT